MVVAGARRFRNHCFNGGTCFRVKNLAGKVCRCPQGFTGTRCELQYANLDLTRRILESEDVLQIAEHGFAHAYAGTEEEVTDSGSSSLLQRVVGEETLMDRVRRSKYGLMQSRRRGHSLHGPEQSPEQFSYPVEKHEFSSEDETIQTQGNSEDTKSQTVLSSMLSKILRIKRHQLTEKYERLRNILEYNQQSPVR